MTRKSVPLLIVWERDALADDVGRLGFSWFSTDPDRLGEGTVTVREAWAHTPGTVAGEVEIAARAVFGGRTTLTIADGRTAPAEIEDPEALYVDHRLEVRNQFWAAVHTKLRYAVDVYRVEIAHRIGAGAEFALSHKGRVHRRECRTITPYLQRDHLPKFAHQYRVAAETGIMDDFMPWWRINRLDATGLVDSLMSPGAPPTLLTRAELAAKHPRARGCGTCRPEIAQPIPANVRTISATTITDRVLGRNGYDHDGSLVGTVTRLKRTSALTTGDTIDVTVVVGFSNGAERVLSNDDTLAFEVRANNDMP